MSSVRRPKRLARKWGSTMRDLKHGKNVWRSCRHKLRYATYDYAIKKALKYTEKYMKAQYVYWCPFCHGYHITGVPQRNERERRIQEIAINEILQKGATDGTTNPITNESIIKQEKRQEESSTTQNAETISQEEQE